MALIGGHYLHVLAAVFLLDLVNASRLDIKNGGFEDFIVAINKDVPYTPDITNHLQSLMEDTSNRLHETTGLHMRSVTIIVPSTWERRLTWEKTDKLTFGEADLRVDKPHPYYRNQPYTHPTWRCGQMQKYIHVTSDFVTRGGGTQSKGTLLANQFASYRWGVFEDIIKFKQDDNTMSRTQEKVCNGRPAWDIIKDHKDYQQSGQNKTQITFTIVYNENDVTKPAEEKQCGRPVVLLLDFSGSMNGDRSFRQQQAATKFIKEILPFSSKLGITAFATNPKRLVRTLEKLISDEDKDRMALTFGGYITGTGSSTGIGSALMDALKMLEENGQRSEESRIVLMTDGEENESPRIADVTQQLIDSKVKVHSIAVGENAEESLGVLCDRTGGQLGKYVESKNSASLTQVINNLWGDFNMLCVEEKPIEIENRAILLDKDHPEIEETLAIDSSIKDAEMTFTPEHGNIEVTITGPDQTKYDKKSTEYRHEHHTHVIKFTFKNMEPGEWKSKVISKSVTSTLTSDKKEQVIMNVKAKAKEEKETYEVRSWLSSLIVEVPAVTRIYAEVTQGYAPLIKGKVTASIELPGEGTVTVELKDDGIWPDVRALDGIYTSEFYRSTAGEKVMTSAKSERYSVDITVTPIEGETTVVHKLAKEEGGADVEVAENSFDFVVNEKDIVGRPVESFQRKDSPGAFEIKNVKYGVDQYPPARVVDLSVTSVNHDRVTIEWTAPGDDERSGTAAGYEFRIWHNEAELRNDFNNGIILKQDAIVEGTLSPSASGSKERMTFTLPENWPFPHAFIALVSRDDEAHQSEVSIIVKVEKDCPRDGIFIYAVYIYATVYFITRLIENRATRHYFHNY